MDFGIEKLLSLKSFVTSRCFNKVVSLSKALIYYSYNSHCEPLMVSASSNDSTANNLAEYDNQGL